MSQQKHAEKFLKAAEAAGLQGVAQYNPDTGMVTLPADDFVGLCWKSYTGGLQKSLTSFKSMSGLERVAALRAARAQIARKHNVAESKVTAEELAEHFDVSYSMVKQHLLTLAGDFAPAPRKK